MAKNSYNLPEAANVPYEDRMQERTNDDRDIVNRAVPLWDNVQSALKSYDHLK